MNLEVRTWLVDVHAIIVLEYLILFSRFGVLVVGGVRFSGGLWLSFRGGVVPLILRSVSTSSPQVEVRCAFRARAGFRT